MSTPALTCSGPIMDSPSYPYTNLQVPENTLELSDSGTITFRYRVVQETEYKKEGRCRYELELREVLAVKADPEGKEKFEPESSDDAVEKAFKGKR